MRQPEVAQVSSVERVETRRRRLWCRHRLCISSPQWTSLTLCMRVHVHACIQMHNNGSIAFCCRLRTKRRRSDGCS